MAIPSGVSNPLPRFHTRRFGLSSSLADNGSRLQNAIDAANAETRGGVVVDDGGDYNISQAQIKSNVHIEFAGSGKTNFTAVSPTNNIPVFVAPAGVVNASISGATVTGRGAGGTVQETGLQISNATLRVEDFIVQQMRGRGIYAEGTLGNSSTIDLASVYAKSIFRNPSNLEGVGIWFFGSLVNSTIDDIGVDTCDGSGILVDAGTSTGQGYPTQRLRGSRLFAYRVGRAGNAAVAIGFAGAQDTVINGYVIDDTGPAGTIWRALLFAEDQSGIPCFGVTMMNGIAMNVAGDLIGIDHAHHNSVIGLIGRNIGMHAGSETYAVHLLGAATSTFNGGGAGLTITDNTDNLITGLVMQQDAGVGKYDVGAMIDSTNLQNLRNRFIQNLWGQPSTGLAYKTIGTVPFTGRDANVFTSPEIFTTGVPSDADTYAAHDGMRARRIGVGNYIRESGGVWVPA